jgi:hypothetical protein
MIEKLVPLKLPPGLFHNGTKYEAKGRWYDANLIRWREGILQPIGGWRRAQSSDGSTMATAGATDAAKLAGFRLADGNKRVVIGIATPLLKAYNPGATTTTLTDITPAGALGTFWSFDVLNGTLIAYNGGKIYEWDGTLANDATEITNDPTTSDNIVVTPEQFLVALGASANKRLVAWASQGTTDTWTASSENTAGDFTLRTDGLLRCGVRTKGGTLLLTSTDAWEMVYQGGEIVYGFRQVGDNCGAISEGSAVAAGDVVYWMGRKGFFRYNGFVQQIPCPVAEKVFGEINTTEPSQVECFVNGDFGEVWWFYSADDGSGDPNDRYVCYNFIEDLWYYGALDRLAGLSAGVLPRPLMIDSAGVLWEHEYLNDRGSETPYIESGPIEIGDGDQLARVQQIVPDGGTTADVRMYLYTAFFPTGTETQNGPYTLANPTSVRLTARQVRLKVEQVNETAWRFGIPRLGVIPSSRR